MASKIIGVDKLIVKLNSLGGNVDKALEKGIAQATKLVQATAKELCPVAQIDGGQLRSSIFAKTERRKGEPIGIVGTNVFYAPYVEYGTGQRGESSPSPPKSPRQLSYRADWVGMMAQPYLYPALASNRNNIQRLLEKNLMDQIKKLGG